MQSLDFIPRALRKTVKPEPQKLRYATNPNA